MSSLQVNLAVDQVPHSKASPFRIPIRFPEARDQISLWNSLQVEDWRTWSDGWSSSLRICYRCSPSSLFEAFMKRDELIFLIEEEADGGFVAQAMGESIVTEAETMEELRENIKDAIACHYDKPEQRPAIVRLHIVRQEILAYA